MKVKKYAKEVLEAWAIQAQAALKRYKDKHGDGPVLKTGNPEADALAALGPELQRLSSRVGVKVVPLPDDMPFPDSPEIGDPNLFCSGCSKIIPSDQIPGRIWSEDYEYEWRYCVDCLRERWRKEKENG